MLGKPVLKQWLKSHPFSGSVALIIGLLAIAIPTAIRASVDGMVNSMAVTPYIPFVLACAVLLGWWNASLVALVSATIGDVLFVGPPNQFLEGPEDMFVVGVFLIVCAAIIGFVEMVRAVFRDRPAAKDEASGIIFSLEKGQAWASRPGLGPPVRLGPQAEVAEMMKDFLAQLELGKRLSQSDFVAAE